MSEPMPVANSGLLGARIRKAERMNVDHGHVEWTVAALSTSKIRRCDLRHADAGSSLEERQFERPVLTAYT
jgi:hypothetical protein